MLATRTPQVVAPAVTRRIVSLDVLRGLAVAGMLAVNNPGIRGATPTFLEHSEWNGFTFADAIFPIFLFAAGASMAFSRRADDKWHAARRVVFLFLLGVALSTIKYRHLAGATGVLQRVALAYGIGWLILRLPRRWHVPACLGVLGTVWAAFTFVHPGGVVAGSWSPHTNLADFVDRHVFGSFSSEGIITTFTAAVNVVAGAIAGRFLRDNREGIGRLAFAGVALAGAALVWALAVPINKKLWTPSYVALGVGVSCVGLAVLVWFADLRERRLAPVAALGANPLAVYVAISAASYTIFAPVRDRITPSLALLMHPAGASVAWELAVVGAGVALAVWMHRRRIFIRI